MHRAFETGQGAGEDTERAIVSATTERRWPQGQEEAEQAIKALHKPKFCSLLIKGGQMQGNKG
jgi:hypothetical protein